MSRKKARAILGSLAVLFFVLVFSTTPSTKGEVASVAMIAPSETSSPSAALRHSGVLVTVVNVVDGDTIKVQTGETVRYIGIDTPETVDPKRPRMCYGKEASDKNSELVEGNVVELEKDVSETDKYGRLLRYVWLGDMLINELLVREGYAKSSSYPPDVKYQSRFIEAERAARQEQKGLWSSVCAGTPLSKPTNKPIRKY